MAETTAEPRTASFKLHRESTERFTLDYKDRDDLYHSFQKKLKELNISPESVCYINRYGDCVHINDADTLFRITRDYSKVKLIVCDNEDNNYSSSDSMENTYGPPLRSRRSKNHHLLRGYFPGRCGFLRHHLRYPGFFHGFHGFDPYYDHPFQRFPFSDFRSSDFSTDPRLGCQTDMHEFDPYYELPSYFSRLGLSSMDPRSDFSLFYGMGRGRGGHHRGSMRGGFHGC